MGPLHFVLFVLPERKLDIDLNEMPPTPVVVDADTLRYLSSFPLGYVFSPTDEQLIRGYLIPKIQNHRLPPNMIHQVEWHKHSPDYFAENYFAQGELTWFFFTPRLRKYTKGETPDRTVSGGYWRPMTGKATIEHKGLRIGTRSPLNFFKGKPPNGEKTQWIMQEYTVYHQSPDTRSEDPKKLDEWVLCKLYSAEKGPRKTPAENNRTPVPTPPDPPENDRTSVPTPKFAILDGDQ